MYFGNDVKIDSSFQNRFILSGVVPYYSSGSMTGKGLAAPIKIQLTFKTYILIINWKQVTIEKKNKNRVITWPGVCFQV